MHVYNPKTWKELVGGAEIRAILSYTDVFKARMGNNRL